MDLILALRRRTHAAVLFALIATGPACPAAPAPVAYFRSDAGHASDSRPLPEALDDPTNVVWHTPLDPGHSTPLRIRGRIVLTTFRPATTELATVALDADTGRTIWRRAIVAPKLEATHAIGSPATASPATDGERLFVFFGSHGLLAYDLDGRPLWERRLGPFQDEYGAGSSPVVVGDRVILQQDHDTDSFLAAFETKTGKPIWRVARPDAVRSYSTPAVRTRGGRTELLVAGALELAGYDPANGERLWSVPGLARIVIPTPVPAGDYVFMASWAPGGDAGRRVALAPWPTAVEKWDRDRDQRLARDEVDDAEVLDRFFRIDLDQDGKLSETEWTRHAEVFRRARNSLLAIKPDGRGDLGESAVVWSYPRGVPYVATPWHDRGVVWMVKDGGIVTRVDAAGGRLIGEERLPGPGSYYASPVGGDGKVYFASQQGVVSVVANQSDWRVLSSRNFREKIYATPVLGDGRIVVRTEAGLFCLGAIR